ncbi:MAG TPA: hypothetical protein VHR88_06540 [Solirubrobacteraceae bacterium]|jgi:hypothetical protein|nr:hypothetical protein [Solirubrobacteraceae bacterium]
MTAFRLISIGLPGALEFAIGLALIVLPFALGSGSAAAVIGFGTGALLVGLALGAATLEPGRGSISDHHAYDWAAVLGIAVGAAALAIAGDAAAGVAFAVAGVAMAALALTTRYSLHRSTTDFAHRSHS